MTDRVDSRVLPKWAELKTALQLNLELWVGGGPFDLIDSQSPFNLDLDLDFWIWTFGLTIFSAFFVKKKEQTSLGKKKIIVTIIFINFCISVFVTKSYKAQSSRPTKDTLVLSRTGIVDWSVRHRARQ